MSEAAHVFDMAVSAVYNQEKWSRVEQDRRFQNIYKIRNIVLIVMVSLLANHTWIILCVEYNFIVTVEPEINTIDA